MTEEALIEKIAGRMETGFPAEIRCGPGWYEIIAQALDKFEAIDPNYKIAQIKEKFGGLRLYYHTDFPFGSQERNQMEEVDKEATEAAEVTCELTGEAGRLYKVGGWIRTLSDNGVKQMLADRPEAVVTKVRFEWPGEGMIQARKIVVE
jgi:hypothetical protein